MRCGIVGSGQSASPDIATSGYSRLDCLGCIAPLRAHRLVVAAGPHGYVASLPLQNAITIATATANLFTIVITTPNNVYKLIVAGQVDQVPAAIQAGIASQVAAFQTFVQLPATIIATDIAAIAGLFGQLRRLRRFRRKYVRHHERPCPHRGSQPRSRPVGVARLH